MLRAVSDVYPHMSSVMSQLNDGEEEGTSWTYGVKLFEMYFSVCFFSLSLSDATNAEIMD